MRTLIFATATALSETEVANLVNSQDGGTWLPAHHRGVIDGVDATVYIDYPVDLSEEQSGLDAPFREKLERMLGKPLKSVLFVHISHAHSGSTRRAMEALAKFQQGWNGVVWNDTHFVESPHEIE